jgi:hypothetical protein
MVGTLVKLKGIVLVLLTSGCINISTHVQPEDTSVKEVLQGNDCVLIFFV